MLKLDDPQKWMTIVGQDGALHHIPTDEEHTLQVGCVCDPVQRRYYAGGMMFIHRVLSC